ncbi:hypothetical protein LAWI1_G006725 [Lachnellula willkommii]|uniref:BTB domain-containing protein n=1 Tax=Lachnellula willkommii TaxID=215461 RepID=A0A559M5B1_9HELO|nr:hypothetical protein LAWI1_G006725 [Lachnellula willkommii]
MTDSPAQNLERKEDNKPKKKGTNFKDPSKLVTLVVGPEKKEFVVHKEFACQYSPVFQAAFNGEFIEGQTQNYVLEDVTEPVARLLVNWLYTQQLDIWRYKSGHAEKAAEDLSIYKLLLPGLQNLIVHTIQEINRATKYTSIGCINYVYENTCEESPLRKLFVHQCACYVGWIWFRETPQHFPKEFLLDLTYLTLGFVSLDRNAIRKYVGIASNPSQYEVAED